MNRDHFAGRYFAGDPMCLRVLTVFSVLYSKFWIVQSLRTHSLAACSVDEKIK